MERAQRAAAAQRDASMRSAIPPSICLSDLSRGVTGEIHHVDAGYHIVGMKHPDAPDIVVGKD